MPRRTDLAKRQEAVLEKMAFITLFYLALSVLLSSVQLLVFQTTDMMLPFKTLTVMGFCYLVANGILSVYYHVKEKRFENPQILFLKIVASIGLIASTVYALPSALSVVAIFHIELPFNFSFLISFFVGIFATIVGMVLSARKLL
jgi:drug/metabolite transporter (DMT)-like permease